MDLIVTVPGFTYLQYIYIYIYTLVLASTIRLTNGYSLRLSYIAKPDVCRHHENKPIQIYRKFHHQKLIIFRYKILIFFKFLLAEEVLTSTHNLCFFSRNKKNNSYPCKPSFTIKKWSLRGSKLYRHVLVMGVRY